MPSTNAKRIIGIDYSLTSPALCYHPAKKKFKFKNCRFGFLTSKKTLDGTFLNGQVTGRLVRDYSTDLVRFTQNAIDLKSFIAPITLGDQVAIEGYAFGARGMRIFQIGEATGILSLMMMLENGSLLNNGRNICRPAPSEIKKYATGKGNSNKEKMLSAFVDETGVDLVAEMHLKRLTNPVDDLIDSYFICKWLHEKHGEFT